MNDSPRIKEKINKFKLEYRNDLLGVAWLKICSWIFLISGVCALINNEIFATFFSVTVAVFLKIINGKLSKFYDELLKSTLEEERKKEMIDRLYGRD